jgi:hypothetical protein
MKARIAFGSLVMMFVLAFPAFADGKDGLQKYFSDVAGKVKATNSPSEKRTILNESFQTVSKALDMVQRSPLISKDDRIGIDQFKAVLQEKQDELAGSNGYVRVTDGQLNAFSDYVVQDMEQAEMVTISLVTLLLIVILVGTIVSLGPNIHGFRYARHAQPTRLEYSRRDTSCERLLCSVYDIAFFV